MRKLTIAMIIIVSLATAFGAWKWYKRYPYAEYVITKNKFGSYDIHLPSGLLCNGYYPSVEAAERQISFLIKSEKPIEVYQGKWHTTYLEVMK